MPDNERSIDLYEQGYSITEIADKFKVSEIVIKDVIRNYLLEKYEAGELDGGA